VSAYTADDLIEYTSFAPGGWSPGRFVGYAASGPDSTVGDEADPLVDITTASGSRTRVRESQVRRPWGGQRCTTCGCPAIRSGILSTPTREVLVHAFREDVAGNPHNVTVGKAVSRG
jgi:hypothetical protein